jgi:hypothetical protein
MYEVEKRDVVVAGVGRTRKIMVPTHPLDDKLLLMVLLLRLLLPLLFSLLCHFKFLRAAASRGLASLPLLGVLCRHFTRCCGRAGASAVSELELIGVARTWLPVNEATAT